MRAFDLIASQRDVEAAERKRKEEKERQDYIQSEQDAVKELKGLRRKILTAVERAAEKGDKSISFNLSDMLGHKLGHSEKYSYNNQNPRFIFHSPLIFVYMDEVDNPLVKLQAEFNEKRIDIRVYESGGYQSNDPDYGYAQIPLSYYLSVSW